MRIGFDGRVFAHRVVTGVERYARLTYRSLVDISPEHSLELFTPASGNRYIQHLWEQISLPRLADNANIKSLYCPAGAAPYALRNSTRLVVTIHDVAFLKHPNLYSALFREYYRMMLPRIISRADVITTVSNNEVENILDFYPDARGKIVAIYPGISDIFREPSTKRRGEFILAVGSKNKHKNLTTLLKAFKSIAHIIPHDLVLVGGNRSIISTDNQLLDEITSLPVGRVKFLGHVADDELVSLYQSASLYVIPSLWEGFGAVPLEAMSCGCPVVASNYGAIPEVCGDAAFYVSPTMPDDMADGILRVIESQAIQEELRANGYNRSAKFTYARTAEEIMRLLHA